MNNRRIASIFREIARLLEIRGASYFRVRAYERAAGRIESLDQEAAALSAQGKLREIEGVGKDLEAGIKEILETGSCSQYEELKRQVPPGLLEMLSIPGLGPRTVKLFYEKLSLDSIDKLERAARSGRLRQLEGIKEKTEVNIIKGIELFRKGRERAPVFAAGELAGKFISYLKEGKGINKIEPAGSLRRMTETVGDIDILAVSSVPGKVIERFVKSPLVKDIIARGETRASVVSSVNDTQVDLRVVDKNSFGSAWIYFTGSKSFNIKLRHLALDRGCKVNEYGVFSTTGDKETKVAGKTEKDLFRFFKMQYIPPELREDRGEVELALRHRLPVIVERKDIKADMHLHSVFSDGSGTIEQLALRARDMGYCYIAVCDHSQGLKIGRGLSEKSVFQKIKEINGINRRIPGITVLCGTEVEILPDGSLDYPDSLLDRFDFVLAAIHSGFSQDKKKITGRLLKACGNRRVNAIAHPTGRLFGVREAYSFDFEDVCKAAADNMVALELNAHPQRMDLNDSFCRQAKSHGVKICVGTDAHSLESMDAMDLGVSVARRAWLNTEDIVNCWNLSRFRKWLKK